MPVVDEARLNITIKTDAAGLAGLNTELGKTATLSGTADVKIRGMATSFLKSQIAMEALKQGFSGAANAFRTGMQEMEKDAAGLNRLKGAAASVGEAFSKLKTEAEKLSADNLIDFADAAGRIADLTQAGFKGDVLTKVAAGLKDIAAAAGGNVAENMERLTEAMLTGRTNAAGLQQMLPSLKAELEALPKGADEAQQKQALLNAVLKDSIAQAGGARDRLGELSGKTQQLGNDANDLKKAWAEGILDGLKTAQPLIGDTHGAMGELSVGVKGLGTGITTVLVVAFKLLKGAVDIAMIPLNSMIEWFIAGPGYVNEFKTELMSLVADFERFGSGLIDAIQAGIQKKWDALKGWFTGKLQDLRDLLPSSDAKTGPLSALTAAGAALWATFAAGMGTTAGAAIDLVEKVIDRFKISASEIGQTFNMLGKSVGGKFGEVLNSIGAGFEAYDSILRKTGDTARAVAGGIGVAMQGLSQAIGGAVGEILNYGSMLLMGFATGGVWGLALAAVVVGISAIINAMDSGGEKARKAAQQMGFWISEELGNAIAEAADKWGVDFESAVLLSLDRISAELGVTENNVNQFINSFTMAMGRFNAASQMGLDLARDFSAAFPAMLAAATNSLGIISDEFLALIARTREWGGEVEAVTNFLTSQFEKQGEAINSLFANARIGGQGEFHRYEQMLMSSVTAMLASGMSVAQIAQMLGPAFGVFADAAERLGLAGNAALAPFLEFQKILDDKKLSRYAQNITDVTTVMATLHNTNQMTREGFNALERTGTKAATKIMQDGKLSAGEWAAIQPYILTVMDMASRYGYTLDRNTQAIVDQARAMGYLQESDPTQNIETGFSGIVTEMGRLNDSFAQFIAYLTQGVNVANQLGNAIGGIPPPPTGGTYPGFSVMGGRSYQGITRPHIVQGTERNVTLHDQEAVMPAGWVRNTGRSSNAAPSPRVVHIHHQPIVFNNKQIAEAIWEVSTDGTYNSLNKP